MLKSLDGSDFTTGTARFRDSQPQDPELTAKIFVKLMEISLGAVVLAELDTGSPWTILETELADAAGLFDVEGEPKKLSARGSSFQGSLVRVPLRLVADEGDSLDIIDAVVFICREWTKGTFVGYSGLLDQIRIGLDPQVNRFHFGPADS